MKCVYYVCSRTRTEAGGKAPDEMPTETKHCRAFYERKSLKPASRHSYAGALRAFFSWCLGEKLISTSPMEAAPMPGKPRKVVSFLTLQQYGRFVRAIEAHLLLHSRTLKRGEGVWFLIAQDMPIKCAFRGASTRREE